MFKKILGLLLVLQLTACTGVNLDQLGSVLGEIAGEGGLSNAQIGNGLKQALEIGIGKGSDRLSMKDGYFKSAYKVLLPEEAQKLTNRLQNVPGFGQVENKILELINRGAEDAARSAKPIFVSAIKQMTFQDATQILMGNKDAATNYLDRTTRDQLYQSFRPKIVASLDKVNATKYWKDAVTAYNKIPLVQKMNPELDDYVTQQALKGLFSMVEKEEVNIRTNVSARSTDLLKQVFAKQDK